MKFGLFYEHQNPKPWDENSENRIFMESLDQIELADRIGIDHVWEVEHHFLEEYSHSSAPEVFLAAASQRTKQIRLGHGINLTAPGYNHPARVAERVSMLDQLSGGRVDWGTGESATLMEMEGFNIDPAQKGTDVARRGRTSGQHDGPQPLPRIRWRVLFHAVPQRGSKATAKAPSPQCGWPAQDVKASCARRAWAWAPSCSGSWNRSKPVNG